MFQQFYELFNALNQKALENLDQDLTLIEDAMKELMNSWTDYMMSREAPPTEEEMNQFSMCLEIVERF